jgi:HD-GYP domain-containing protein (c-di-GMP phosphodiesterase class II)
MTVPEKNQTSPSPEAPAPPVFVRRGRILWSLLAVLVFVGLAPLATIAWKLIDINREALKTAQQQFQMFNASSIVNELDTIIEGLEDQLVRSAQAVAATVDKRRSDQQRMRVEIEQLLAEVGGTRVLLTSYKDVSRANVTSFSAGRLAELPDALDPLFVEGFGIVAARAGSAESRQHSIHFSRPVLLADSELPAVLVMSTPVVTNGKFRGVLSALVDLEAVWATVMRHHRTPHSIYVLDKNGSVLVSSDPVHLRPGMTLGHSPLVQRFLTMKKRARETMPFSETVDGVEEEFLGSYEVSGQGWGIFVRARLRAVYLPVRAMIESTLTWSLVALGMAALAAVFFARSLSNPVNKLAKASHAFALGKYTTRVTLRSSNEIGELAHTFNVMAAKIEDDFEKLRLAAEENNELFLGTIRAMAQAIDAKDPYTKGHSFRVNRHAVTIARNLGLPESEVSDIDVASLLHDVGKIGIDDKVLNKPGKLSEEEFELMKQHPVLGANIMQSIPKMAAIIPGLRWHHERIGGNGYPDGLKGDEIPLMARIIAVADTFDAVTTTRPYQKKMTFPDGLKIINKLKGVALDVDVVEAFNRAYNSGQILKPEQIDDQVLAGKPECVAV